MAASDERVSEEIVHSMAARATAIVKGDIGPKLARELLALRAERDRLRAVADAARRWREYKPRSLATTSTEDELVDAIDALDREESSR